MPIKDMIEKFNCIKIKNVLKTTQQITMANNY